MPVVGDHLNTGSIIEIGNEYWVCLTPACDLVPGQKSSSWENRIGARYLPFKAVLLHEAKLSTANGNANSNEYVYLNLVDPTGLKAFSFTEGGGPIWDTFYASNQGVFAKGNMIGLAQVREISSENNSGEHLQNGETEATESEISLSIKNVQAKVVAELRYEYALNLLQRLGANQTRVGLDFIEKTSLW
ncbi:hypothetical protein L9G15_19880 [Shewanella sp. A3A]|nr:hypothetical protein [Shewanella ferrihydritica]